MRTLVREMTMGWKNFIMNLYLVLKPQEIKSRRGSLMEGSSFNVQALVTETQVTGRWPPRLACFRKRRNTLRHLPVN
jgi:hypothetical protein